MFMPMPQTPKESNNVFIFLSFFPHQILRVNRIFSTSMFPWNRWFNTTIKPSDNLNTFSAYCMNLSCKNVTPLSTPKTASRIISYTYLHFGLNVPCNGEATRHVDQIVHVFSKNDTIKIKRNQVRESYFLETFFF